MNFKYLMEYRKSKDTIKKCCTRLEQIRNDIQTADQDKLKNLKAEADVITKEISAIRLMQGYDRLLNNLIIALVSAVGGGGVLALILQHYTH